MRTILIQPDFQSWRGAARLLLADGIAPENVLWDEASSGAPLLLLDAIAESTTSAATVANSTTPVPRAFLSVAPVVACHRDPARWGLLYRILWRLTHGERALLDVAVDDDVYRLTTMERAVGRDRHKMTAFVRFREVAQADGTEPQYVAWHKPDHHIVRLTTPFFVKRFGNMRWSILTPDESVTWDGPGAAEPVFGPGMPASHAPKPDDLEHLWRTYYSNIFNPARINVRAMKRELPVRHWPTLPEAQIIDDLLRDAPRRVEEMMKATSRNAKPSTGKTPIRATPGKVTTPADGAASSSPACGDATGSAADFLPATRSLPQLRAASATCRGCELYCNATQTVFGEGPADAQVMFVGEQPGDQEDRAGKPFVGPAGKLWNQALEEAGIPRETCYVTNTVKHFKFEPRGERRIHAKPNAREIAACKPWLESEIEAIKPKMIVCLGATAAQALLGREFRVTQHRGEAIKSDLAPWVLATVHPSSLLRIPDPELRERSYAAFVEDLKLVARQMKAG